MRVKQRISCVLIMCLMCLTACSNQKTVTPSANTTVSAATHKASDFGLSDNAEVTSVSGEEAVSGDVTFLSSNDLPDVYFGTLSFDDVTIVLPNKYASRGFSDDTGVYQQVIDPNDGNFYITTATLSMDKIVPGINSNVLVSDDQFRQICYAITKNGFPAATLSDDSYTSMHSNTEDKALTAQMKFTVSTDLVGKSNVTILYMAPYSNTSLYMCVFVNPIDGSHTVSECEATVRRSFLSMNGIVE